MEAGCMYIFTFALSGSKKNECLLLCICSKVFVPRCIDLRVLRACVVCSLFELHITSYAPPHTLSSAGCSLLAGLSGEKAGDGARGKLPCRLELLGVEATLRASSGDFI